LELLLPLHVEGQLSLPILLGPDQNQGVTDLVLLREPLRRPLARQIRLNQLQLELGAVPPMVMQTHDDLRADCLKGQSVPPDLSTRRGSLQFLSNSKPLLTQMPRGVTGSPSIGLDVYYAFEIELFPSLRFGVQAVLEGHSPPTRESTSTGELGAI
jgi:hypothetical protein